MLDITTSSKPRTVTPLTPVPLGRVNGSAAREMTGESPQRGGLLDISRSVNALPKGTGASEMTRPSKGLVNYRPMQYKRAVDGVVKKPQFQKMANTSRPTSTTQNHAEVQQPIKKSAAKPRKFSIKLTPIKKQRNWRWLQVAALTIIILVGALFAQTPIFGQAVTVIYILASIIWRIPSRTTFLIAVLSLITTTILLVLQGNLPMANNFATYTFLLLTAGVIGLGRELKKEGGRVYSNRKY